MKGAEACGEAQSTALEMTNFVVVVVFLVVGERWGTNSSNIPFSSRDERI